jgi:nitrite reductase (NADH) small subunit
MSDMAGDVLVWVDVGGLDDIPRLGCRVVTTPATDIALFRTAGDLVFALHDKCPHKAGKLSQGIVHGESVTCPLHSWVIGLADGQAKEPDEGCSRTVPVRLQDGRILLAVAGA